MDIEIIQLGGASFKIHIISADNVFPIINGRDESTIQGYDTFQSWKLDNNQQILKSEWDDFYMKFNTQADVDFFIHKVQFSWVEKLNRFIWSFSLEGAKNEQALKEFHISKLSRFNTYGEYSSYLLEDGRVLELDTMRNENIRLL